MYVNIVRNWKENALLKAQKYRERISYFLIYINIIVTYRGE